jgi:tRNA-splicing ligase RtcB (3'-phosphate/5'-hydroxy nucleic acid ligase)
MDISRLVKRGDYCWEIPPTGPMRVPVILYGDEALVRAMDDKVAEQAAHVAALPGVVKAVYTMPDAHWGYGFPIGGVAAFDPEEGGVVSAGGVGFDISCGVRALRTGLDREQVMLHARELADALYRAVPAGVGSTGRIHLGADAMAAMLRGGARWAVAQGYGRPEDLGRIEENGCMPDADPRQVSARAQHRQQDEMGTLGSGNHYLEVQYVAAIHDARLAAAWGIAVDDVVISLHCGSRGLGHQIGTEFLRDMAIAAGQFGIALPDRELACAPIRSEVGAAYLGAMRAGINCALANRQIITHLTREAVAPVFPDADLRLLYDVSHNTCKIEEHESGGSRRRLYIHRKGATRAWGPGHPGLPADLRASGQPVLIGGSMGTASYILAGVEGNEARSFSSACHGAGRAMSRHQATRLWKGRALVDELAGRDILIRSPSLRGVAEEAPGAYKDVTQVIDATEKAGLARAVARLQPMICIKG